MNCSDCGQIVPSGSRFCPHCGTAFEAPAAPAIAVPPKLVSASERFVGRVWALERIDEWLQQGHERLFLLLGEPGSGKSQLSAWLCGAGPAPEDPQAVKTLERVRQAWSAACFCMSRGQGGSIDAAWYIRSLVEQLSNRYEGYADCVLKALDGLVDSVTISVRENRGTVIGYKADNLKLGAMPDALDRHALTVTDPLERFARANPSETIVVLVDGVDEALGQNPPIVELVARAGKLPDNVRFFVTTRHTDRIVNPLRDAFDRSVAVLDISSEAVQECSDADILAYVNSLAQESAGATINPELAGKLVEQAAGNFLFIDFLMNDLAAGLGDVDTLPATPVSLYELYRSFLDRVVPGATGAGVNEEWLSRYLPLLGTISVAVPAAPRAPLWQWLGWNETQLAPVLEPVQQLTEWAQDDGGGWRLYHRSMGEFLATAQYPDPLSPTPQLNSYYVSPPEQHDRIVSHYLKVLEDKWGGSWNNCDDTYCLRNLIRHMASSIDALATTAAQVERTDRLFALLGDPSFRARQAELLAGLDATVDDFRIGFDLARAGPDVDRAAKLVETLAAAPEADLRGLAVEWLVGLYRTEPPTSIQAMEKLLSSPSPNAWRVALNAAFQVS